nr:FeoB-associated Cys-rich membrane protein [uncultured Desulfobulbus sp.]
MQQILVVVTVALVVCILGRRLWKTFRNGQTPGCGCGCSGCCGPTDACRPPSSFPMHKP